MVRRHLACSRTVQAPVPTTSGLLPGMSENPPQKPPADEDQRHQFRHKRKPFQFRAPLLSNPKYFGNFKTDTSKPFRSPQTYTIYEELKCAVCQPQFEGPDAVVYLKQFPACRLWYAPPSSEACHPRARLMDGVSPSPAHQCLEIRERTACRRWVRVARR